VPRQAGLCWGQRYIWLRHHQLPPGQRHELNFVNSIRPVGGATIDSIRRTLDLLVRRHEGLRTTCHADAAGVAGGGPVQRVHPPRAAPVVCYDTRDHPAPELARLVSDFTAAEFALDAEWPFRACIVSADLVPTRVILVGHHITFDDWSMDRLRQDADELHESIMARRPAALPPVRHHPVDLARYEASADAADARRRSREHWRQELRRVPADLYGTRRCADPGGISASLSSPAMLAGVHELAARHGTWPSIVCTAAFTALLAAYTGSPAACYRTYAGNRDAPGCPGVLTCMFQPVLVTADCSDNPSFAEVIARTARQCAQALASSYGPYDEIMEDVSRLSSERGADIRVGTVFNYLRHPAKTRGGQRTTFNWNAPPRPWMFLDDDCYLRVSEWGDCVMASLSVRSAVMGTADAERFLRGFEALLTGDRGLAGQATVAEIGQLAGFSPAPAAAQPARAAGGERLVPRAEPEGERERLLHETVRAVNGLGPVSMAQSYVLAGGKVMNIPRVQQILRERGWTGPSLQDIAGARPLAAIAAMLAPAAGPAPATSPVAITQEDPAAGHAVPAAAALSQIGGCT